MAARSPLHIRFVYMVSEMYSARFFETRLAAQGRQSGDAAGGKQTACANQLSLTIRPWRLAPRLAAPSRAFPMCRPLLRNTI
jgi:hypothetical protein